MHRVFDVSRLPMEAVNVRERGSESNRFALTLEQVQTYDRSARPVNLRYPRERSLLGGMAIAGEEVEAIDPATLLNLVEESKLKSTVPTPFLKKIIASEGASIIASLGLANGLLDRLRREAYELVRLGLADEKEPRLSSDCIGGV